MAPYKRPTIGHRWLLMSLLLSETACSVQKIWFICVSKLTALKLFFTFELLKSVATDILGPLPKGRHGFQYFIVIADRLLYW